MLSGCLRSAIFKNGYFGGNTPHFLVANRQQPTVVLAKGFGDISRNNASDVVSFCRFLHSSRDIDRASVDADGPLRIALLADHHLAAMDPDPEGWNDAKLLQKIHLLSADCRKDGIDRPQDPVASNRLTPIPQRDETVAFVEINFAAVIGDRLRDIEEELADQGFRVDCAQPLGEPSGVVDIEKQQDLFLDHGTMVGADRQMKQGFDANEMNGAHDNDPDDGKRYDHRNNERQSRIRDRKLIKGP